MDAADNAPVVQYAVVPAEKSSLHWKNKLRSSCSVRESLIGPRLIDERGSHRNAPAPSKKETKQFGDKLIVPVR